MRYHRRTIASITCKAEAAKERGELGYGAEDAEDGEYHSVLGLHCQYYIAVYIGTCTHYLMYPSLIARFVDMYFTELLVRYQ